MYNIKTVKDIMNYFNHTKPVVLIHKDQSKTVVENIDEYKNLPVFSSQLKNGVLKIWI